MRIGTFSLLAASILFPGLCWSQNQRLDAFHSAKPALGELAPLFKLKDLDGKEVSLASFKGKVPVVIEFGSYT